MIFIVRIFWNENEGRLRALWRLTLQTALVIAVLLVTQYVIVLLTALVGWMAQTLTPEQLNFKELKGLFRNFSRNHYDLPILAHEFVSTLAAVWLAGRFLDRRRLAKFGLQLRKNWWIDLGFGLFLGGALITLVFLIELAAGWVTVTGMWVTQAPDKPFAITILYPLATMILVGVTEELTSRGYQLTNLAEGLHWKRLGRNWALIGAVLLSATIFALLHLGNPHASAISTFSAFMGGVMTGLAFILTGQLAIPIGLHITWNFFQSSVFGFTVSGMDYSWATIFATEQSGPAMWVGDAFGPESGLLAIGAVGLGCLLIPLWVRLRTGSVALHTAIAEAPARPDNGQTPVIQKKPGFIVVAILIIILLVLLLSSSGCIAPETAPLEAQTSIEAPLPATDLPQLPTEPPNPTFDHGRAVLAFTSQQDGNMEIYTMRIDGSSQQRLTNNPAEDYWPTWSPDGAHIAFASNRDGDFEIYVIDADGDNLRRLTEESGNDLEPAWSPDGGSIAFMVYQGGKSDIYIMNSDGSERRKLTEGDGDHYLPKWSPDGAQIVFVSERDGNPEIYIMNADGGDPRRLTDDPADDRYPSWSSDGAFITFYSDRDGKRELYVMDVDGQNPHPLTSDNAQVWVSDWSPDGELIAFTSTRDGNREIYIMSMDGSNLQRLTNNNVLDGIPAWRP